jgi:hypothetical protein
MERNQVYHGLPVKCAKDAPQYRTKYSRELICAGNLSLRRMAKGRSKHLFEEIELPNEKSL